MGLSQLSRSVSGARVLITGAGSGMGRATARLFADEGARVFLADWDRKGVEAATAEIQAMYGPDSAACLSGDVAIQADRESLISVAVQFLGGIDILVNNAGISRITSVHSDDTTFQTNWDETLAVNVSAHAHLIRLALPQLLQAPRCDPRQPFGHPPAPRRAAQSPRRACDAEGLAGRSRSPALRLFAPGRAFGGRRRCG